MSEPQPPALHFRWLELLPDTGQRVKQLLHQPDDIYTPRHLLGMAGSQAERIIYRRELVSFIHHALESLDPELAFVSKVVQVDEQRQYRHIASRIGMANFPPVRTGFGEKYDVLIFAQAQGTDDDTYSDGLDYLIKSANDVLKIRERPTIPTLRDYLYPVDRFRV